MKLPAVKEGKLFRLPLNYKGVENEGWFLEGSYEIIKKVVKGKKLYYLNIKSILNHPK
jgi:hypothetical protein